MYGSYYYGRNQNAVFLAILAAVTFSIVCSARRRSTAYAAALASGFWVLSPIVVSPPPLVDPAAVDNYNLLTARINAGEQWRYEFTLRGLDRHVHDCGALTGRFYIAGENMTAATLAVTIEGTTAGEPEFLQSNGLDQVVVTAEATTEKTVAVVLRARPGQTPAMRLGPESVGRVIYSDAVFFELRNPQCTIVYHSMRDVHRAAGE
jgi:hypothetical protein